MKRIIITAVAAAAICGCKATRTKDLELNGMFTQAESGTLAIGSIEVQAAPIEAESVSLKMWWDSPFLAPSEVRPCARLMVSGTNTCAKADAMVEAITKAIGINFYASTNRLAATTSAD